MDTFIEVVSFLAIGAGWGVAWLAVFSLIKQALAQPELLRLLVIIFVVTSGITAIAVSQELMSEYITASDSEKDRVLARFEGEDGIIFITQLVMLLSPIWLLLRQFRSAKIVQGAIAICYVLVPYYSNIVYFITG